MVVYILSIQADLEGVASLTLKPDADLCFSVRHPIDQSEVRERIVIDRTAYEEPVDGGANITSTSDSRVHHHAHGRTNKHHHPKHAEAPCHFALKWPGATQRSTIRVIDPAVESVEDHGKKSKKKMPDLALQITADDSGRRVALLALDCEDIEPFAFHLLGNELVVTNTAGETFDSDLEWTSTGKDTMEWSAYDLASGTTRITDFRATIDH
mmetsp:Transcript_103987/g.291320  ORF Transcript_103987/g.291320 Transcript_103987/m.291320 type:complete len:211 (-) Transcript_103987:43-675(-)